MRFGPHLGFASSHGREGCRRLGWEEEEWYEWSPSTQRVWVLEREKGKWKWIWFDLVGVGFGFGSRLPFVKPFFSLSKVKQ